MAYELNCKGLTIYRDNSRQEQVLNIARKDKAAGNAFNIGGGSKNVISVWNEFAPILEKLLGHPIQAKWGDWRPGDQKVFVSDIRKAKQELDWEPKIGVEEGIRRLYDWVVANKNLF